MRYDVVIVTYNSEKWLEPCVKALASTGYENAQLNLIFVDNASADNTLQTLAQLKAAYPGFGGFTTAPQGQNGGFSKGCNAGAGLGSAPYIFFLNADTEPMPGLFAALDAAVDAAEETVAAFECRQLPFETAHHINPVTMETAWASGAALLVRRTAFEKVSGFDERLFMYCEDVDLSWRLRAAGYTLQYVPHAGVVHHAYTLDENGNPQIKLGEYAGGLYSGLLLRYKYGTLGDIWRGNLQYLRTLRHPQHYPGVRKTLARNYLRHLGKLWGMWLWRLRERALFKAAPASLDCYAPDRGIFPLQPPQNGPLVSVVIRTCGRPATLHGTLQSLTHQTYRNFEVVLVEDGPAVSEALANEFAARLNLRYHATGQHVGRSRAGNHGLEMAKGEWLNFLDDDDFFYPDHIELMVSQALATPAADLVVAANMLLEVDWPSRNPYEFKVRKITPMLQHDRMDLMTLCAVGRIPIQTVMFRKALFTQYGGLNEALDGNEDWSMWLKYFSVAKRIHEHSSDIPRATSLYLVPADKTEAQKRVAQYNAYEAAMLDDESITFTVTPRQMRGFYEGMKADMRHLRNTGRLDDFLDS